MILGKKKLYLQEPTFIKNDHFGIRFPGGSNGMQNAFKKAFTAPLDPNAVEYQVGNTNAHAAILAYKRFEDALDNLPSPTAVICKTANRASAVLAAYKVGRNVPNEL
jgi:DNA-binding LacI/PurR family transcriptional regulator